jgi:hypothetical protein
MNDLFVRFAKGLTVYALIITLLSVAIYYGFPKIHMTGVYLYLIALMYAINFLLFVKLSQALQNKPNRFINAYMLLNFGKLFLYIAIIATYIFMYREDAISFTLTFFVYYVLFTAYEIITLLKIKK